MTNTYQNWFLETDEHNILWIYFDKKDESINTLDRAVMEELADIITNLPNAKGIVIASRKTSGFIAGADINQFGQFKDINEATHVLSLGQQLFAKIEQLAIPSVALIDGFCLGGGMELALACRYRIANEDPKTRLGLPEVRLGIHPGWGGTIRLPKLIGAPQAFNLMLSGHTVSGKAAAKLGFVDAAVPKRQLKHAAIYYILQQPAKHQATTFQKLTNYKISRQILAHFMRKKTRQKANPSHYPSPFQMIDNWEQYGVDSLQAYEQEAKKLWTSFL